MRQLTLATAGFEFFGKSTRRAAFLGEMDQIVPWQALCGHCHVGRKRGRHCHRSDRTQSVILRFGYTSPVAKSERRSRGSAGNRMLPSGDAVGGNDHR
jgi:hypothetical protein